MSEMLDWQLFVGTFTKEFAEIFHGLRTSDNAWERNWTGGGTANSGWKSDPVAYQNIPYAEGVERYAFDPANGTLRYCGTITDGLVNPQYVAFHPTLAVLYAPEYTPHGRLRAFAVSADGATDLGARDSLGRLAIATAVHPTGNCTYVAHFGDGNLSAITLDDVGRPRDATVIARGDRDPGSERFSRHHQVRVTPNGNAVLVTDVARDELTVYGCNAAGDLTAAPVARLVFPPLSAPRHIEFHPAGHSVYVVTERESSVFVLEADAGVPLRITGSYPTCPADFTGNNRPSELCLDPRGRYLYVGNRGLDAITIYAVGAGGALSLVGHQPGFGRNLSCLRMDPTGGHLVVGNVNPGNLVTFRVGPEGTLQLVGDPIETPAPRSLAFCGFPTDPD